MQQENYLVWLDLEMTGLNPQQDAILEIATIITDNNLDIVAIGPDIVINQPDSILAYMDDWVSKTHKKSGLTEAVQRSRVTIYEAQEQTLEFIKHYCKAQTAPLCGNSIYQDRAFLRSYMPELESYLHYRIIDISSVKELIRRWYPTDANKGFKKPENHRALEDVQYSIAELAHYRKNFFIQNNG